MKHLNIIKWLSIIVIQVQAKLHKNLFISTCSSHWNQKIVEVCEKKVYGEKHSFITLIDVVGAHWNCLIEDILMCNYNMLLKIRKMILNFTFIPSVMSIVFASFKHLELPISIKMPVTIL